MQVRTAARRMATVGALAVPLGLAATGLASATEAGHCVGGFATQEGGLVGLDAAVDPALTVGSVLGGSTAQQVAQVDRSNAGIVQSGCGVASQRGDLLGLDLDVSPVVTIGGILSGATQQSVTQLDESNSGIVQG